MELIVHPTIKQKKEISYNHIINLSGNLDIYIGNEHSREAEHFNYIIQLCNENEEYETQFQQRIPPQISVLYLLRTIRLYLCSKVVVIE